MESKVRGRPRLTYDLDKVKKLASYGLSVEKIADYFGVTKATCINSEEFMRAYNQSLAEVGARVRVSLMERMEKDTIAGIYLDKTINRTMEEFQEQSIKVKREELEIKKQVLGLEREKMDLIKVEFVNPKELIDGSES